MQEFTRIIAYLSVVCSLALGCGPSPESAVLPERDLGEVEQPLFNNTDMVEGSIATRDPSGRMYLFMRGKADNHLWFQWRNSEQFHVWSNWIDLGPSIVSRPFAARNNNGRMQVFSRGSDGIAYYKYALVDSPTTAADWTSWQPFSRDYPMYADPTTGESSWLSIVRDASGRLAVFMRSSNNQLLVRFQTAANAYNSWEPWIVLTTGINSDPSAIRNVDGRLEVFVRKPNSGSHEFWSYWQSGAQWGQTYLGYLGANGPIVGLNGDGRLEVFALGFNGLPYRKWQTVAAQNTWTTSWSGVGVGGPVGFTYLNQNRRLILARNNDMRLQLFGHDTADSGYTYYATSATAGSDWASTGWVFLGRPSYTNPVVVGTEDGRLRYFAIRDTTGGIYERSQWAVSDSDTWVNWVTAGSGSAHW